MEDELMYLHSLIPLRLTWQVLFRRIEACTNMPDMLKNSWTEAVSFLRVELGNGFFNACGLNHPAYLKLSGTSERQVKETVEWVDVLRVLKNNQSNYFSLLGKLKSNSKSITEAMPFIAISKRHLEQNFKVNFPEEVSLQKNPDMEVLFEETGERIYIEVSRLTDSEARLLRNVQFDKIYRVAINSSQSADIPVAGEQYSVMDEKKLTQTLCLIETLKKEAILGKKLAAYKDEEIAIAFVHPLCHDEMLEWCSRQGVDPGLKGVPLDFDDTPRMIKTSRIYREAKQIPQGKPGILYFPVQFLYYLKMDLEETVMMFSSQLSPFCNIVGMVLYTEIVLPGAEPFVYR